MTQVVAELDQQSSNGVHLVRAGEPDRAHASPPQKQLHPSAPRIARACNPVVTQPKATAVPTRAMRADEVAPTSEYPVVKFSDALAQSRSNSALVLR